MADRKENELTKANNFDYVRALDSNGNSIKISKSDLVSVLEGLIGTVNESRDGLMLSSGFIQRKQLNSSSDYNDCLLAGIYDISQARGS